MHITFFFFSVGQPRRILDDVEINPMIETNLMLGKKLLHFKYIYDHSLSAPLMAFLSLWSIHSYKKYAETSDKLLEFVKIDANWSD